MNVSDFILQGLMLRLFLLQRFIKAPPFPPILAVPIKFL